jgi:hypothetical protein
MAYCGHGLFCVAGLAAKQQIGLLVKNLSQTLTHDRMVVYNQNPGFLLANFIFVWQCATPYTL